MRRTWGREGGGEREERARHTLLNELEAILDIALEAREEETALLGCLATGLLLISLLRPELDSATKDAAAFG